MGRGGAVRAPAAARTAAPARSAVSLSIRERWSWQVGSTGVGALTLAFLILLVCTLVFVQKSQSAANKTVAHLSIYICGFASMAYFAMLSGQGWTTVAGCRQFFFARYLDWAITFPLLTVLLGTVAGAEWVTIYGAIGAQGMTLSRKMIPCSEKQRQIVCRTLWQGL